MADAKRQQPEKLRARSLSAGLTVDDIQKSIAWYRDVLGFHVDEEWRQNGELLGASLIAGSARLYLGQDDWAKGRDRQKGEGVRLHLATGQSIDEIAARAKAAGGRLDLEPHDTDWGTRAFGITDPNGYKMTISSTPGSGA